MRTIKLHDMAQLFIIALKATGMMAVVWKLDMIYHALLSVLDGTKIGMTLDATAEAMKWLTTAGIMTITYIKLLKEIKERKK